MPCSVSRRRGSRNTRPETGHRWWGEGRRIRSGQGLAGSSCRVFRPRFSSPTVRNPAKFLHVEMDQIARVGMLVADRSRHMNGEPGIQIDMSQQRHPVAGDDLRHRRLEQGQGQVVADGVRTPPASESQRDYLSLCPSTRLVRWVVGSQRPIGEPSSTVKPVPGSPLGHGRPRYLKAFSDTRLNPTAGEDELDELAAAPRGQRSVGTGNVRDELLRGKNTYARPVGERHLWRPAEKTSP